MKRQGEGSVSIFQLAAVAAPVRYHFEDVVYPDDFGGHHRP
jgi:hypothetical protein